MLLEKVGSSQSDIGKHPKVLQDDSIYKHIKNVQRIRVARDKGDRPRALAIHRFLKLFALALHLAIDSVSLFGGKVRQMAHPQDDPPDVGR